MEQEKAEKAVNLLLELFCHMAAGYGCPVCGDMHPGLRLQCGSSECLALVRDWAYEIRRTRPL